MAFSWGMKDYYVCRDGLVKLKTEYLIGIMRSIRHILKMTERCLTTEQPYNKIASLQRRSAVKHGKPSRH